MDTPTPLSVVDHSKYLGVILQSDLNRNKHVEQKGVGLQGTGQTIA